MLAANDKALKLNIDPVKVGWGGVEDGIVAGLSWLPSTKPWNSA